MKQLRYLAGAMALRTVTLKNFTVFEDATFELCPGINVLIGANATGKTHAMKAMYAVLRATPDMNAPLDAFAYHAKLKAVFMPGEADARRLVRRGGARPAPQPTLPARPIPRLIDHAALELTDSDGGSIALDLSPLHRTLETRSTFNPLFGAIYIPSREVLSMYEGFIAAYQGRELSFDETFYDLCVALNANLLRGERAEQAAPLLEQLEAVLGGKVILDGNRFYVQPTGREPVEAHLVAEGLRKVATLARLVASGAIDRSDVLLWDEPETNLSPRLTIKIVEVLVELARHGVQVVLATHDYLLSHRLSLLAEYGQVEPETIRFFGLARSEPEGPVGVVRGDTLADLPDNPVVDEFARHYDFERELFDRSHGGRA